MKDEDFQDLLDEVNTMSNEEYNAYHKQALNIKENVEMTEESKWYWCKGKPFPRKNKFDMGLYKKVLEGKRIDPTKFTVTETGQVIKPPVTDEEKAEIEFEKINKKYFDFESLNYDKIKKGVMQSYLDGLAKGRKEVEKEDIDFCNAFCLKADKRALLEQIERMKCGGNCITLEKGNCLKAFSHTSEDCRNCDKWEMKE